MTAAVCGCGHPHLPGQTHCYTCGLAVPTNVPPAAERAAPPARETATPEPPAGGTCICGRTTAACAEAGRKAASHG